MKRNQLKSLYIVVGFVALSSQALEAGRYNGFYDPYPRDEVRPEEVILGVVGAIAAGVGIYALGSYMEWWGAPSNEELIAEGRQYVSQASRYAGMFRIALRAQSDNHVCEDALYECALLNRGSSNISEYGDSLKRFVNNLRSTAEKLSRRIGDIERDRSAKYRYHLDTMRTVERDARGALDEMSTLSNFLQTHRGYFKLFEAEDAFALKYARELGLLQQYAYNQYDMSSALYTAMAGRHAGAFGIIKAVYNLQDDIAILERALSGCGYHYANRIECSRLLSLSLKSVLQAVVADKEYARMLAQYEAAERDKERLRLERERVANERRIASAKEREAYAREREARAHEEQNRLKEQELYDNRVQAAQQHYRL